jgi:hypothetical protein
LDFLSLARVRSRRLQLLLATVKVKAAEFGHTFVLHGLLD